MKSKLIIGPNKPDVNQTNASYHRRPRLNKTPIPTLFIVQLAIFMLLFLLLHSISPTPTMSFVVVAESVNHQNSSPSQQPPAPTYYANPENPKPVIIATKSNVVASVGSNQSISCSAKGLQPLQFVWFQDEKNMATKNNSAQTPSTTKLLEEKRYDIYEDTGPGNVTTSVLNLYDLKITDTSMFLCWVENSQGYQLTNFSLTVSDLSSFSDYFRFTSSESPSALMLAAIVLFITLLLSFLTFLLIVLRHNKRPNKNNTSGNSKQDTNTQHDLMLNYDSADESSDGRVSSAQEYDGHLVTDGFMETMRSGIINIDYHSMSPVIQFNTNSKTQPSIPSQHHLHMSMNLPQQQNHHHHQASLQLIQPNHSPMTQQSSIQRPAAPVHAVYQQKPAAHLVQHYQMKHPNMMQVPQAFDSHMHTLRGNPAPPMMSLAPAAEQQWINYQQQQQQHALRNHGNQQF